MALGQQDATGGDALRPEGGRGRSPPGRPRSGIEALFREKGWVMAKTKSFLISRTPWGVSRRTAISRISRMREWKCIGISPFLMRFSMFGFSQYFTF